MRRQVAGATHDPIAIYIDNLTYKKLSFTVFSDHTGHETYLSTKQLETQAAPRLSCADAHPRRTRNYQCSPCPRQDATERVDQQLVERIAVTARAYRLLSAREFRSVLGCRWRSADRLMRIFATDNRLGHPRLGLAVSRRVSRKAVLRNRIKRQIRESFRMHRAGLGAVDIVVVARPDCERVSREAMRTSLAKHWARISPPCAGH